MDENTTVDLAGWWHAEELGRCPQCGNRHLTPPSPSMGGMRVCLTCGVIGKPEGAS
jgi:hypothetical protein